MDLIKELIKNEILLQIFILTFMGITILISHSFVYRYLLNKNFIFTALMLPPLVLAVTKVISTNLYLSLGMIGALSIVRYRTPVKSQYELALYFAFICLGIIGGVNFYILLKIYIYLLFVPLIFILFRRFFGNLLLDKQNISSISETVRMDIILKDTEVNNFINKYSLKNNLLKLEVNKEVNESFLTLNFESYEDANEVSEKVLKNTKVKSINLN